MSHKAEALSKVVAYVGRHDGRVEFMGNWHKRGGSRFDPKGFTVHHDASARGSDIRHIIRDGHSTLSGPLANLYLTRSGQVVVIAAGRANHAGRGGWQGLRGNSSVWGLEIANDGTSERYSDEQLRVVRLLMRAFHEVDGVPVGLIHSHAEWAPRRKRDPAVDPELRNGPWDMDRFRHDVQQQPDPKPDPEDDMLYLWQGEAPDGHDGYWLVQFGLTDDGHKGRYTAIQPDELDTWQERADNDPQVRKSDKRAAPSWFASLKRV